MICCFKVNFKHFYLRDFYMSFKLNLDVVTETRKRGLRMRTYMVVPTNETNGLIEWVSNLKGLRLVRLTPITGHYIPIPHSGPFSHLRCVNGSQTYLNLYICI